MKTLERLVAYLGFQPTGDLGPLTIYTNKRGRTVSFPKAPPLEPATLFQKRQRLRFQFIAEGWQKLSQADKAAWELATKRLSLYCTGYNLFTWWHLKYDWPALNTIQRQSGITLHTTSP